MIIFLLSYNNIRIITNICIICLRRSISTSEEPHAPQIKRDDELQQDVGGAYAGPFNEGEELRLVCQVHGGDITPASQVTGLTMSLFSPGRPLPSVFWYVDDQAVPGRTHTQPGKDVVVNRLRYSV